MKKRLQRILTVCLGGFWLLDGILQLQPAMFTGTFVSTVLSPNLQNQPIFIAHIIGFGIDLFAANIFWFNLGSALIQLLIGAALLLPLKNSVQHFFLWLSIAWALIIWIFGEGFGSLMTGSATFYTGAPGSALLYLILALFLLYASKGWPLKKLPLVAGVFFLISIALNLAPMSWQPAIVSGLLGTLGIFLVILPSRSVAWITIVFLIIVWWVGQNFGGLSTFPNGTATDPNSAPLFMLFLLPVLFTEQHHHSLPLDKP